MVMKKLISILLTISIAAAALAQPQHGKKPGQVRPDFEKLKAERVAFITSEVGLTSEDAQAFWPIYNKAEEQQKELQKAEKKAYMELNKALKEGGNVDSLLDAYIKAKQANVNVQLSFAKEYKKAIGAEKTAKFYACDEKFRRQQIGKLGGHHRGPGAPGMRDPKGQGGPKDGFNGKPDKDCKQGANCNGEKNCKDCKKAN